MKLFLALDRKAHIFSELFCLPFVIFLFFETTFLSPFHFFYIILEMHSFLYISTSLATYPSLHNLIEKPFYFYTIFLVSTILKTL